MLDKSVCDRVRRRHQLRRHAVPFALPQLSAGCPDIPPASQNRMSAARAREGSVSGLDLAMMVRSFYLTGHTSRIKGSGDVCVLHRFSARVAATQMGRHCLLAQVGLSECVVAFGLSGMSFRGHATDASK